MTASVPCFSSLACLADVHGSTAALEAVMATPQFAAAEAVAFLGCTTTGPDPLGVLELCATITRPVLHLAGNGERAVLQAADGQADWETGRWLAGAHGPDGLAVIRSWPQTISCEIAGLGPVRLCHGSPRADNELLTPQTSAERITQATAGISEPTVVHGHTHLQYQRRVAGRRVIGPGSVGLPYHDGLAGARWAVIGPGAELLRTACDLDEVRRRVLATAYPDTDRYLRTLAAPPRPDDIIADAEARLFSD